MEGLGSEKAKYLKWLLLQSVAPKVKIENVITEDAVAMLSEKLSTPLQLDLGVGEVFFHPKQFFQLVPAVNSVLIRTYNRRFAQIARRRRRMGALGKANRGRRCLIKGFTPSR